MNNFFGCDLGTFDCRLSARDFCVAIAVALRGTVLQFFSITVALGSDPPSGGRYFMAVASAAAVAAAALAFATPSHRGSAVVRRTGMPGRVCPALQSGVSGPLETKFPCEDSFDQKQRLSALCQWDGVLF